MTVLNLPWRELLLPDEEEKDPEFGRRMDRLSIIGLRIIAGVAMSGVAYFTVTGLLLPEDVRHAIGGPELRVPILSLAVVALVGSWWAPFKPHARIVGSVVGYGVAVSQYLSSAQLIDRPEIAAFLSQGIVTGVMLVGITALPLKPVHAAALGGAITLTYAALTPLVFPELESELGVLTAFLVQVVVLCTALTVIVYRQRVHAYRAHRSASRALEELRAAQARLLVSENAHSQTRFAAALSHELNTPLGALTSAFDTLVQICRKAELGTDDRYTEILSGAETAGRGSAARLLETVERMAYLTNLDRAEEQTIDVNELCRQTAASLKKDLEAKTDIDFDLGVLPPLRCRPQQLSAVLSNLLRNAAAAIETRGRITIMTRKQEALISVTVRDTGRGMPEAQLETLFEPAFQNDAGRIRATNWSLFVCRAIVAEHGGELTIESAVGVGTSAKITLPWA